MDNTYRDIPRVTEGNVLWNKFAFQFTKLLSNFVKNIFT